MNAVSEDIKDLLVTAGVGTFAATTGWAIYINAEPHTPDTVVTVFDTGGPSPGYCADVTAPAYRYESVQIRVRGVDEADVKTKIRLCQSTLETKGKFTAGDMRYERMSTTMEPAFLTVDENHRPIWTASFAVQRHAT